MRCLTHAYAVVFDDIIVQGITSTHSPEPLVAVHRALTRRSCRRLAPALLHPAASLHLVRRLTRSLLSPHLLYMRVDTQRILYVPWSAALVLHLTVFASTTQHRDDCQCIPLQDMNLQEWNGPQQAKHDEMTRWLSSCQCAASSRPMHDSGYLAGSYCPE